MVSVIASLGVPKKGWIEVDVPMELYLHLRKIDRNKPFAVLNCWVVALAERLEGETWEERLDEAYLRVLNSFLGRARRWLLSC